MKLFFAYLKSRRRVMAALFVAAAVFAAAFYLYHLPLEAVAYPVLLCAFFGAIALCVDFRRVRARHIHLLEAVRQAGTLETELPEADSIEEADYRALVAALRRAMTDSADQAAARYRDTIDYYMENARIMREALAQAGLKVFGGVDAPYIWFKTPEGLGSWAFFEKLLHNIHVVSTPGVGFGPAGEGYFRLSGFGDHERTKEAMARIEKECTAYTLK